MLPGPSKHFLPLSNKPQVVLFCLENISQIFCICLPIYLLLILWEGGGRSHRGIFAKNYPCVDTKGLNMEVDLQSLFGLHVTLCEQLYSLSETPQLPPPPAFGLLLRGRYWSAKIDDISLSPPGWYLLCNILLPLLYNIISPNDYRYHLSVWFII
jgi:hypothetical protein